MGGIKKIFKKITHGVGKVIGGVVGGGGGGSAGSTVVVSAPAPVPAPAVSPTDITGQYSGSEDSANNAVARKKKAGKRSLSVSPGENSGGATKGLNVV